MCNNNKNNNNNSNQMKQFTYRKSSHRILRLFTSFPIIFTTRRNYDFLRIMNYDRTKRIEKLLDQNKMQKKKKMK